MDVQRSWEPASRVDNGLTRWTAEEYIQAIENVSTQDSLLPREIRLELARVFLPIQPDPNEKAHRYGRAASHPTDYARHALCWVEVKLLAVGPRQSRRVRARVRYHAIQNDAE